MKTCRSCHIEKDESEYSISSGVVLKNSCKGCVNIINKKSYYKNHERTKKLKRASWIKTKEKEFKKVVYGE